MDRYVPLVCAALLFTGGCTSESRPGRARVSDDDQVQVKFHAAYRTLQETKELKRRGHDYAANCKTMKMLFLKDLKKLQAPAAKRLAKDIVVACQGAKLR